MKPDSNCNSDEDVVTELPLATLAQIMSRQVDVHFGWHLPALRDAIGTRGQQFNRTYGSGDCGMVDVW